MKRNKGITLIALVITIIVLLILAGVAIAMLSGENGILRKATEAKTKTEEMQKNEEESLGDMEIEMHFLTNNSKYKCRYGYITGIGVSENAKELKEELKNIGYELKDIENKNTVSDTDILTTGMTITKNGKEIARTVIFGDVNCDGFINYEDGVDLKNILNETVNNYGNYKLVASNSKQDEEIDSEDYKQIMLYVVSVGNIDQNSYVNIAPSKIKLNYSKMQEYMKKVNEQTDYEIKYDEENDKYTLIVENGTTIKQIKDNLPDSSEITFGGYKTSDDTVVIEKHYIFKSFPDKQEDNTDYGVVSKIYINIK